METTSAETESLKTFLMRDLYPATKQDLLSDARRHGLEPEAYRRLERIPDRDYDTSAEVGYALDAVEYPAANI
jgi:hypothetical protein